MSYFCPSERCEGWQLVEGDNFCPSCGSPAQTWELLVEQLGPRGWQVNPVLGQRPARLKIRYQGPGDASLDWIEVPPGVKVELPSSIACQQELNLGLILEEPPAHFFLGNLQLWYWPEPELRLRSAHDWVDPEAERVEVWLEVLRGAYYLDELPAGWSGVIPVVLSEQGQSNCVLTAPQGATLGPADLPLQLTRAGQLQLQCPEVWECGWQSQLDLSLLSRGGPLLLDWVETSRPEVEVLDWPRELVSDGQGVVRLQCNQSLSGPLEVRLLDRLGRRWSYHLTLQCSEPQEFPGWVLLDWGSHQVSAALVHSDGQVERLEWDFPGLGRLRQQLGLASWQALSDEFCRLWDALQALPSSRGWRFTRLVLTHPVGLTPRQLGEFRTAVSSRWEGHLVLLAEPLAAAYHFLSEVQSLPSGEWRMLLWDVGGSTCDTALLKVKVGSQVSAEVEEVGGDPWFGGQDITDCLASLLEDGQDAEKIKCEQPPRELLDPLILERLRLGLPPHAKPQLLVLSGRGSQYPLMGEWLQQQYPGVTLRRSSELKWGVVLGARYCHEVVAWLGPRSPQPGQPSLHFPKPTGQVRCSTRLGLKQQGPQGAVFRALSSRGQVLPQQAEWSGLALVYGENWLEIVENLGWSDDYRDPSGQLNPALVTLRRLNLPLPHTPEPEATRLVWRLAANYELEIEIWEGAKLLARLGPVVLW